MSGHDHESNRLLCTKKRNCTRIAGCCHDELNGPMKLIPMKVSGTNLQVCTEENLL